MKTSVAFLKVGIGAQREEVVSAVERTKQKKVGVFVTLDLRGTALRSASLIAWPYPPLAPKKFIIDVVTVDQQRLQEAITWEMPLDPDEKKRLRMVEVTEPPTVETIWTGHQRWCRVPEGTPYREWQGRVRMRKLVANAQTYTSTCPECGHLAIVRAIPGEVKMCLSCRRFPLWRRGRLQSYLSYTGAPRSYSGHRVARILELKETGRYTQTEIAKLVGVTPQYVSKIVRSHLSSSSTPEEISAVLASFNESAFGHTES